MKDTQLFESVERELNRQRNNIELIASENFVSEEVLQLAGSVLTNKYAEGYPAKRYYGGCQFVDEVEELARQRICEIYGACRTCFSYKSMGQNMLMFNHIVGHKLILQFI